MFPAYRLGADHRVTAKPWFGLKSVGLAKAWPMLLPRKVRDEMPETLSQRQRGTSLALQKG